MNKEVTDENGPFSFVLGSQKHRPTGIHNLIQEANDSSGFSSSALSNRKQFAALPALLRKKGTFGNDLQLNDEATQQIQTSAWKIVGNKGLAVIFDSKGIHRGGMVINNERIVLTCVVG